MSDDRIREIKERHRRLVEGHGGIDNLPGNIREGEKTTALFLERIAELEGAVGGAMKERPILFTADMVRAILDGRKTQTRRPIKPQPDHFHRDIIGKQNPTRDDWNRLLPQCADKDIPCPYGQPGDRLWVQEAFRLLHKADTHSSMTERIWTGGIDRADRETYAPDFRADCLNEEMATLKEPWRSPRHMPRWASRITLEITDIRVEGVQEIGGADALAEGIAATTLETSNKAIFGLLWDSIYAAKGFGWDANPWVWVIEFRRVK